MSEQRLRITQVRSLIGRSRGQRATVRSLGLKRIRHTVEQPDRPEIRGMIRKVGHLVTWQVVGEAQEAGEENPRQAAAGKPAKRTPAKRTPAKKATRKATETAAETVAGSASQETADEAATKKATRKAPAKKPAKKAAAKKATKKATDEAANQTAADEPTGKA